MARMTLYKELHGHDGCVNTLYWSHGGDKLLSGSDDTMVCVWLPWEDYRMAYSIETGHNANIFSAKFMPKSSDSVIVTAAGDSEIRVFDVNAQNEHQLRHVYTCHRDRAKRIALQDNPYEFLSCSEDGTVRHFDLRQPHICSHTAPFGERRSSRNYPRPTGTNVQEGCPAPLIDYGKYGLDLNTISINKTSPQYLLVAGMDDYIYLHDRRMVGRAGRGAGRTRSPTMESRCVRRFTCTSENYWKRKSKHVTACKFSDANSQEFIGSWSTDGIFLFNIHDSPVEKPSEHNVQQSSRVKRRGKFNEEPFDGRQSIIQCFRTDQLNNALDRLHMMHTVQPSPGPDEVTSEHDIGETVWILCLKAAVHLRRVHESTHERPSDDEYGEEEIASARKLMQDAESWTMQRLHSWRILWCLAIGYWIAGGGQRTIGCEDREDWLHKAYRYALRAQQAYESTQSRSASSSSTATDSSDMFKQFKSDIVATLRREDSDLTREEESEELDEQTLSEDRWKWLDEMYTFDQMEDEKNDDSDGQTSKPSMKRARRQSFNDTREPSYDQSTSATSRHATVGSGSDDQLFSLSGDDDGSSSSEASRADLSDASSEVIEIEFTQDYIGSDSEMSMSEGGASNSEESHITDGTATSQDDRSMMDTDEDSDDNDIDDNDIDDNDIDDGETPEYHRLSSKKFLENDVDLVTYRKRYFGHCNNRTVKDVNFYGLNDEYIVSGSDDGCAFVWEKTTGRIVQILTADSDTVNVIQGHPSNPTMAISGIDNTIKIFSPISASPTTSRTRYPNERTSYSASSRMYDLENILTRNEENNRSASDNTYIAHSMLTAVTRSIQNGAELGRIREMMHDNFQGDIDCRVQ
ncbi:WD40-repeat-containing domain protein [Fennellomyces sp. T-0311]|nr:WD40-repeat-containing domain protein [Fennellomyces sp. T-0311]